MCIRDRYKGPFLNNAALLLINCVRTGLLREGLSIVYIYGHHCIPDNEDLRYQLASYALLSCCQCVVTALRGAGLRFERVSYTGLVVIVRRLGAARVIALGVNPNCVHKAARQRGCVLPCLEDSALFGDRPNP